MLVIARAVGESLVPGDLRPVLRSRDQRLLAPTLFNGSAEPGGRPSARCLLFWPVCHVPVEPVPGAGKALLARSSHVCRMVAAATLSTTSRRAGAFRPPALNERWATTVL